MRKHYLERRSRISAVDRLNLSHVIVRKALELPLSEYQVFHCFASRIQGDELDTQPLITYLFTHQKIVALPRIEGRGLMSARRLRADTPCLVNRWGIPEPPAEAELISESLIEVVFVPLLAFDRSGARLGYGGGFYDRLYAACTPDTLFIGLSLLEASERPLPQENHDLRLDMAVSPTQTYRF